MAEGHAAAAPHLPLWARIPAGDSRCGHVDVTVKETPRKV